MERRGTALPVPPRSPQRSPVLQHRDQRPVDTISQALLRQPTGLGGAEWGVRSASERQNGPRPVARRLPNRHLRARQRSGDRVVEGHARGIRGLDQAIDNQVGQRDHLDGNPIRRYHRVGCVDAIEVGRELDEIGNVRLPESQLDVPMPRTSVAEAGSTEELELRPINTRRREVDVRRSVVTRVEVVGPRLRSTPRVDRAPPGRGQRSSASVRWIRVRPKRRAPGERHGPRDSASARARASVDTSSPLAAR